MSSRSPRLALVADAVPVAAAIGVFGVIYGATASSVLGPATAVTSSVLLFSGAAQFTMVAMVDAGAGAAAIVLAVTALALRHVPLAAVVRPRLPEERSRRAFLALVLLDETAGLALASHRPAARTMAVVGVAAYLAWVLGTAAGALGADLVAAASLAGVVFVILFIGLSALTCRSPGDRSRAAAAAVLTTTALIAVPGVGAPGAIVIAGVCAATTRGQGP